jgi:anti-anti-sigma factor
LKIASYTKGDHLVLKIHPHGQDLPDLAELEGLIVEYLDQGARNIAVNFVNKSYIYSGELRVLISCYKLVQQRGGTLCIIEPNSSVYDVLMVLNIDKLIKIYASEDLLPPAPPSAPPEPA